MGMSEVSDDNTGSVWNRPDHGRQPLHWRRGAFVLAAGLALASCGGDSDSSEGTTIPSAPVTAAPAATVAPAPVATAADTSVAPVGTDGEVGATSCPDGYVDFDGVYPLRICDRGDTVTTLQQALVDRGHDIVVDGLFGPQTQDALLDELDGVGEIATQADLDALTG
jgi:hypothetical protein